MSSSLDDFLEWAPTVTSVHDFFHQPPIISTKLMKEVKDLPQGNKTFLIFPSSSETGMVTELLADTLMDLQFSPNEIETLKTGSMYRVVEVNLDRFHRGKRTKVFTLVTVLGVLPDNEHAKKERG
jgi:hypothetical protein